MTLFIPCMSLNPSMTPANGFTIGWTVRGSNPCVRRNFPHPSRPALGPTQPPALWVPGLSQSKNRPGRGVDHSPPSSADVKERVELCLYSPFGHSWPVLGLNLPLPFTPANAHLTHKNSHLLLHVFCKISGFFSELYIQSFKAYCTGGWGSQISWQSVHESGKVVSPKNGPLYPPQNISDSNLCWRLCRLQGHSGAGCIMLMSNYNDSVGNRTRDLKVCIAVLKLRQRVPRNYCNRLRKEFTLYYKIFTTNMDIQVS